MNDLNEEFQALGLNKSVLKAVTQLGFKTPTPVQSEAIPSVLQGQDLMGLAQTGTGKTAAFGLPLVQNLMETGFKPAPKTVRALILAPTRELANQISENLRSYAKRTKIRVNTVVGGVSINGQRQKLLRGTDILVATPGRLLDHAEKRSVDLSTVEFLVLDEADQMLDLGFIHTLRKLEKMIGKDRQTLLFSATMPKQIEALAKSFLSNPVRVEAATPGRAADKVRQSVHFVETHHKISLLKSCLSERPEDVSIVFARTKHGAEKLMKMLVAAGLPADSIHGNKSQGQRERTLAAFRRGEVRVLVATDVAARGIDIPGVTHVYNYDLPEVPESYVHRIGRTARAGAEGEAVAFCCPETVGLLSSIEKLLGTTIEVASGERLTKRAPMRSRSRKGGRRNRSQNNAGAGQQGQKKRKSVAAGGRSEQKDNKRADWNEGHACNRAEKEGGNIFKKKRPKPKNRQHRANKRRSIAA